MNLPSTNDGRQVLADYYHLSDLIQKQEYSQDDKNKILNIMNKYNGLLKTDDSKFISLIETRGHLIDITHTSIQVNGRAEVGFVKL